MASIARRDTLRPLDPDFYRREAARNAQIAEQLEGVPTVDKFEQGQVITFEKVFPGTEETYLFAAVKFQDSFWAVTGARQHGSMYTWQQLLDFIGLDNLDTIEVVTDVDPLKIWYRKFAQGQLKPLETEMPPAAVDAE